MTQSLSITFARGARRVTGSNFLLEAKDGDTTTRILVDCGLSQGEQYCETVNTETFSYDPASVDAIFFTHAHADHIGLFPKLVKDGFRGKAYATAPTRSLMPVMLEDSVKLMKTEAERCGYAAPYDAPDVDRAVSMLESVSYGHTTRVGPMSVTLYNAGHILGSAVVCVDVFGKRIAFTGDLGRVPTMLVPDRDVPEKVDVLITESVYGNRIHGSIEKSEAALFDAIRHAARMKGTLLIPAFSLERTQIILAALDKEMTSGGIPRLPVFMDSPLAARVTAIYRQYPEFLREEVRARLNGGDDPFAFPSLKVTEGMDESKAIDHAPTPKVIVAGAGMSHGGRIRRHEATYLPDPKTAMLLVGYQVPGSLGRRVKDGAKHVQIDGQSVRVRAKVLSTDGFSAHADRDDLMTFVEQVAPKRVFVVLGETEAASFLAQRISGFLGLPVDVPREGETFRLS